jgi:hypothetical protein
MKKSRAVTMMESIQSIGEHLNKMHELSERIQHDADKKEFRRHLGEVMAAINADIIVPIIEEYPDLDPDQVA